MILKDFRENKGISQVQASDELGVSIDVYISWETRKRIPRPENMKKITEWSNGSVQPNDFYFNQEEESK